MSEFLLHYRPVAPTTWAYLSSFLMIGLFLKFHRLWSMRNLDLILLILLAPGLLILHYGYTQQRATRPAEDTAHGREAIPAAPPVSWDVDHTEPVNTQEARALQYKQWGFRCLLGAELLLLLRTLLDPSLGRRPLLSPNLTADGLAFMGIALFLFLMVHVISAGPRLGQAPTDDPVDTARMDRLMEYFGDRGPGYAVLGELPVSANRTTAVVSHSLVILGLILIGWYHFDNLVNGIGAAMLYLMLPYTTQLTGRIDHFLPAAFLVWAILCYRRPLLSGMWFGAAAGCIYYPLFLLPLWISFYHRRGWIRFLIGVAFVLSLMTIGLIFTPSTPGMGSDLQRMFGLLAPAMKDLEGIWNDRAGGFDPAYRIPVLAIFAAMATSMALWPAHKSLASLISGSAAVMLGAQFWHGWGGGLYIAWFLPLLLLTIFRPNLEDRVATTAVLTWGGNHRDDVRPAGVPA